MKYKIIIFIIAVILFVGIFIFFRFAGEGQELLRRLSEQGTLFLPLVVVAALIDSINPCAFSVLLLTIAFLFSIGQFRSGILKVGGAYILGLFIVYILIGLGILQALHFFYTPNFMAKIGASLLILLGAINIINEFFPKFPIKLRIPHSAHHKMAKLMNKASIPTAFLLGGLVGLSEFPCTGSAYLMVLGLLHDTATYLAGFGYLILYNLIFILPLVIILLIASNHALLTKIQTWQQEERRKMRFYSGIAMIILGVFIFSL
jgi:cytochrome c biogenesis protein CcdA